eukprot:TRINITY_DN3812_c0_g1_i1.p1 TRINITY_DN3812_c0_g1~~TRINITY_DN3812_c0_g1_i1.p1  ORF type:complete len:195 (+),score=38.36 TRINITY_DN3812_c0_g1_i1:243-827(+)
MMGRSKLQEARKFHLRITPGAAVTLKNPHSPDQPFIGKCIGLEKDRKSEQVTVKLQWFYHPEESTCGRQTFHGSKELFLSDHVDEQKLECVEGVIQVHSLKDYEELSTITSSDYFWRYNYKASTGEFRPKSVPVYCSCEEPYNPDLTMVECEKCNEWFHLTCVGLSPEELEKIPAFYCQQCDPSSHPSKRPKLE